jgi:hypothetical protein
VQIAFGSTQLIVAALAERGYAVNDRVYKSDSTELQSALVQRAWDGKVTARERLDRFPQHSLTQRIKSTHFCKALYVFTIRGTELAACQASCRQKEGKFA